jgi:hypothetical protein
MDIANWCRWAVIVFAVYVPSTEGARARDLSAVDFSLRLPAALSKFSPYSDVAGVGGASAGSQYQSSINPAATDWQPAKPYSVGASAQYSAILFDRGPTLHVSDEAATLKTPDWGSLQPAAAQVRSVGSTNGAFNLLNGEYGQVQWGYKFSDGLAVGLNANYTALTTQVGFGGTTLATNDSQTYDIRAGLLGSPSDHLFIGLVADYAASPATTTLPDPTCGCLTRFNDTTRQLLGRIGLSYEYADKSSIYLDYQYGNNWNSTGGFSTNRLFTGVEHQIRPWLYARAGVSYDLRGILSPTAGIGLYPTDSSSIDISFQSNMFPELIPEFGRSKLFGISAAVTF